jgi:hypothetical protein
LYSNLFHFHFHCFFLDISSLPHLFFFLHVQSSKW